MERTFEYRMRPNTTQESTLCTVLKASRRLYNDALAEWKAHFEATRQYLSLYEQDKHYNKTTYPDVPAVVTYQVIKRLHGVLTAYFKERKEGGEVVSPMYLHGWATTIARDAGSYWLGYGSDLPCGG
jgi:hypothetical protein